MIHVFVVDDHQLIREGLQSLLEDEGTIRLIGLFKNGEDLLAAVARQTPDVILMDINLPGLTGLELCKTITTDYPAVKVIGLSTSDQVSVIKNMLASGASGYLLKDASRNEIVEAIESVHAGRDYLNRSVADLLKSNAPASGLPLLTRREKEILILIADGLTNAEIAAQLFLSVATVDSHRKNMLTKFDVKNTAALVKLAITNYLI